MPGLIEQVLGLGLERKELIKDYPKAMIGGERIPYPPKDMASLVTILKGHNVQSYLALEVTTDGGAKFLEAHLHIPKVLRLEEKETEISLRKMLRTMAAPVDLVSIDGRGLPLDPETIWKYIQGGRDEYAREFGKGAPIDYGIAKLKPGACVIVNLADPASREIWYKIRARYSQSYQSPFVGMIHVPIH
jgi:hypothetical protein